MLTDRDCDLLGASDITWSGSRTAGGAWSCSSGNGFSEAECCGKNCRCSSWDRGAVNAVTELVLTTAVLVRNSLGIALLLVILAVGAGPLVRYGLLSLTYRFLAAVAQPVSDKRLVEAFGTMAEGCALLMRILFTAEILCMLTFLILMAGGGLG